MFRICDVIVLYLIICCGRCATQVEAIHMLGEQIGIALAQAEEVGAKGDVEASLKLMQKVEDLKAQKVVAEVRRQIVP